VQVMRLGLVDFRAVEGHLSMFQVKALHPQAGDFTNSQPMIQQDAHEQPVSPAFGVVGLYL